MGCCGQGRAELRGMTTPAAPTTGPERPVAAAATARPVEGVGVGGIMLRYLERSPIQARGPVTGRQYAFSGEQPVRAVDRRDAEGLLQTGFFRRT